MNTSMPTTEQPKRQRASRAKEMRLPLASLYSGHRTACKSYGVKLLAF